MIDVERLKAEMDKNKMSISKLATVSGVDKSIISRILSKESKSCTIGTANAICKALKLSSDDAVSIFFK